MASRAATNCRSIPIAVAIWIICAIWVIYRVVRGYLLFKDSRAIPGV